MREQFPDLRLGILGTDIDPILLHRAERACYPRGCLRDCPTRWRETAFEETEDDFCLKATFKSGVTFELHDVRSEPTKGPFDLVLCRNLAFTYFDEELQAATAQRILASLRDGGALILGSHEQLPAAVPGFSAWSTKHHVYLRHGDA